MKMEKLKHNNTNYQSAEGKSEVKLNLNFNL